MPKYHYYAASDGRITIFRASERTYKFGRIASRVVPGTDGKDCFVPIGAIGFSNTIAADCRPAAEITKTQYEALIQLKEDRLHEAGHAASEGNSPQHSWVLNTAIEALLVDLFLDVHAKAAARKDLVP